MLRDSGLLCINVTGQQRIKLARPPRPLRQLRPSGISLTLLAPHDRLSTPPIRAANRFWIRQTHFQSVTPGIVKLRPFVWIARRSINFQAASNLTSTSTLHTVHNATKTKYPSSLPLCQALIHARLGEV